MKPTDSPLGRRSFLKGLGAAAAGVLLRGPLSAAAAETPTTPGSTGVMPRRKLGRTNEMLSVIGVGGHTLARASSEEESIRIAHEAIDQGINFMDNAWEYHEGRAEDVMGKALKGGWRDKVFLMTKMCTHGKGKDVGMRNLEESLRRLQTDHLDLWMIHDLRTQAEVDAVFAPGGSIDALEDAKKQGKIRFVGFTGHQDPKIHMAMLKHDYPFEAVLMPINPFDPKSAGFRTEVLPELTKRNIGVLGMKSLGGANAQVLLDGKLTAQQAVRFALSQPITALVSGMLSLENLRQNIQTARNFTPMSPEEQKVLTARLAVPEEMGRYCHYHHPSYHDGDVMAA